MPNLVGVSAKPRFRHRFSLGRKDIKESMTIRNDKKPGYIVSVGDIKWESKCNVYWYGKRLQWTIVFYDIKSLNCDKYEYFHRPACMHCVILSIWF